MRDGRGRGEHVQHFDGPKFLRLDVWTQPIRHVSGNAQQLCLRYGDGRLCFNRPPGIHSLLTYFKSGREHSRGVSQIFFGDLVEIADHRPY